MCLFISEVNKMNDLISIIVPVYNVEKYLPKCIDSIISQTYSNLEIILVDDGSTDMSHQICDDYSKMDNRIKVIHKKNGGVSSARNLGLNNSTGEYIGFIDPDDYIEPNMYECLLNALKSENTEISMCGYNEIKNDKIEKTIIYSQKVISCEELLKDIFNTTCMGVVWNKLFKRSLFINNETQNYFYENLHYCEDLTMLLNIFNSKEYIAMVDKPLYNYIITDSSICHNSINEKKLSFYTFMSTFCDTYEKKFPELSTILETYCFDRTVMILIDLYLSNLKSKNTYISKFEKDLRKYHPKGFKRKIKRILLLSTPNIFFQYKKITKK